MWYLMQVREGFEERIAELCNKCIPKSILKKSFLSYMEARYKFHGEWVTLKRRLFQGYIFLDTNRIEEVKQYLNRMTNKKEICGVGKEFVRLSEDEVDFLLQVGGKDQIIGISEIELDGFKITVLNGPLKGKEGLIKKINKHKRRLYLDTERFDGLPQIELGFKFAVEKAEQEKTNELGMQSA